MLATENSASHRVITREERVGVSLEPSDLSGVREKVPHMEQEGDVGDSEGGEEGTKHSSSREMLMTVFLHQTFGVPLTWAQVWVCLPLIHFIIKQPGFISLSLCFLNFKIIILAISS